MGISNGKDGEKDGTRAAGKDGDDKIISIVDNTAEGTVIITMNDGANTQYTFRKASIAMRFAILNAGRLEIDQGTTGVVRFTVNPSNAYISTNTADWTLGDVATGAVSAYFSIESIAPYSTKAGQYTAVIRCNALASTIAVLELNAGTTEAPAWVSSAAIKIGITSKIVMTANISSYVSTLSLGGMGTTAINLGDGKALQTVTLTSTETVYTRNYSGTTIHNIGLYGPYTHTGLYCYEM